MSNTFYSFLICAVMAMTPVIELRGALPFGMATSLPLIPLYIVSVICNLLPVPFIVIFMRKLLEWMINRGGALCTLSLWIKNHARKRLSVYYKYELLGLFVLVAVPLPGTGAWTGALIASLLDLRLKYALPVIAFGVAASGCITLCLSAGVFRILAL